MYDKYKYNTTIVTNSNHQTVIKFHGAKRQTLQPKRYLPNGSIFHLSELSLPRRVPVAVVINVVL